MHAVANEARTIEGRLSKSDWIVGDACSAVDMVIFPGIQLLEACARAAAAGARAVFALMPVEVKLSITCPLARARRGTTRLRAHLSPSLALNDRSRGRARKLRRAK